MAEEVRMFVVDAESKLMACHRRAISGEECIEGLEIILRKIGRFERSLEKSIACDELPVAGLESLIIDTKRATRLILRMITWLENDGLKERVLPPCGGSGVHACFALRAPDAGLQWVSLINWSFDGNILSGFDHVRQERAIVHARELVDWRDLRQPAQA